MAPHSSTARLPHPSAQAQFASWGQPQRWTSQQVHHWFQTVKQGCLKGCYHEFVDHTGAMMERMATQQPGEQVESCPRLAAIHHRVRLLWAKTSLECANESFESVVVLPRRYLQHSSSKADISSPASSTSSGVSAESTASMPLPGAVGHDTPECHSPASSVASVALAPPRPRKRRTRLHLQYIHAVPATDSDFERPRSALRPRRAAWAAHEPTAAPARRSKPKRQQRKRRRHTRGIPRPRVVHVRLTNRHANLVDAARVTVGRLMARFRSWADKRRVRRGG